MNWLAAASLMVMTSTCMAQNDPTLTCFGTVAADPRLDSIRGHISLASARGTTFAMLSDDAKPDEAQRAAISAWATGRGECMTKNHDARQNIYPVVIAGLAEEAESRMMSDAVDLYQGKTTFGEYNKRRQAMTVEINGRWMAEVERLKTQRSAQDAADRDAAVQEQEHRRAVMLSLIGQMQPSKPVEVIVTQPPRTTITNCQRLFNGVNCTTQ